jgi:hypothetical protein
MSKEVMTKEKIDAIPSKELLDYIDDLLDSVEKMRLDRRDITENAAYIKKTDELYLMKCEAQRRGLELNYRYIDTASESMLADR